MDHSFKKARFFVQDTKKMDCPAKVITKDVIYSQQYKVGIVGATSPQKNGSVHSFFMQREGL